MKKYLLVLIFPFLLGCMDSHSRSESVMSVDDPPSIDSTADATTDATSDASSDTGVIEPIESAGDATTDDPPVDNGDPVPDPVVPDPIPKPIIVDNNGDSEILLSLLGGGKIYLYDGDFYELPNTKPVNCGFRCFTDDHAAVYYDASGDILSSIDLIISPDLMLGDWIIEKIDPATAQSLGAKEKDYTRIYYQDIEVGFWALNEWKASDLIETLSGEVIAIDSEGAFHPLTSELMSINFAGDLLIYDFDSGERTATVSDETGDYQVTWSTNYFNISREWLFSSGIWYSWNGYEFDGVLTENANDLWGWNVGVYPVAVNESPTLIGAGTIEDFLYWIECNTGWLIKFNPETNVQEPAFRLYQGDGLRLTGVFYAEDLKPIIIGNFLYFHYSDSIWKIDIEPGIVSLFFGGNGRIERW